MGKKMLSFKPMRILFPRTCLRPGGHGEAGGGEGPGGLPQRQDAGPGVQAAAARRAAQDALGEADGDSHGAQTGHQPGGQASSQHDATMYKPYFAS